MSAKIPVSPQTDLGDIPPNHRIIAWEILAKLGNIAYVHEVHTIDSLMALFYAMNDVVANLLYMCAFGVIAFFSISHYLVSSDAKFFGESHCCHCHVLAVIWWTGNTIIVFFKVTSIKSILPSGACSARTNTLICIGVVGGVLLASWPWWCAKEVSPNSLLIMLSFWPPAANRRNTHQTKEWYVPVFGTYIKHVSPIYLEWQISTTSCLFLS